MSYTEALKLIELVSGGIAVGSVAVLVFIGSVNNLNDHGQRLMINTVGTFVISVCVLLVCLLFG